MRIIGGEFSSRIIEAPEGIHTRPTLDQVREAVFSALGGSFEGGIFLDLYAGSGANGLEALSRGMSEAYFVDNAREAIEVIKRNIEKLGVEERSHVYPMRAKKALSLFQEEGKQFTAIYLDPPFAEQENDVILSIIDQSDILIGEGVVIIESSSEEDFCREFETLEYIKDKKYGKCKIHYYRKRGIKK